MFGFNLKKKANDLANLKNKEFVELCYEKYLERPCDFQGRENYIKQLNNKLSRLDLIKSLVSGAEYYTLLTRKLFGERELPDLTRIRPDQYSMETTLDNSKEVLIFKANDQNDFNWLEDKIISERYYESVGVWSFAIDNDKKIFSEIVEKLRPKDVLEIGCSTGSILKLLNDKEINCEGIEISHLAIGLSYQEIKNKIHFGDILSLQLKKFDVILGLDIFEHLNPNKLRKYLKKSYSLLNDNGYMIINIPAYGDDIVFGEIFPIHLEKWKKDKDKNDIFHYIPVDNYGWPENGHLTLATSDWWVNIFEESGLKREIEIENVIHKIYDGYWTENTPGRKSIYVFSKSDILKNNSEIINNFLTNKSAHIASGCF